MSRSLKQWEAYLSGAISRVRLLSELGLNYEDMLEIANLFREENSKRKNLRQTTTYLVANFPCTFISFLAAFAAQNTEREFWEALGRLLTVSGNDLNNANWRKPFIDILNKYNKPTFENVGGQTNKYVTSIRIHGGIPSYSLRDFFTNMLVPSIEKPEYVELKGKELLEALLGRSVVQLFTDSTVRNFFENSGEIGLDFLESSRDAAREYRLKKQVSSENNLPAYVVQRLINFLEYQEDEIHGLRRPRIKFDAEGDGLLLELPEQPFSGVTVHGNQVLWQVFHNQQLVKEINTRIVRSGHDVLSVEQTIPIGYIVDAFQVRFSVPDNDGEYYQMREWNFDIRSQEVPNLFVFREDGDLLRWSQSLPAQNLLIIYPKNVSLAFEGNARVIHTPTIYADGWSNWQANYYSLEEAWSLSLKTDDDIIVEIPIQKQLEIPRLIGHIFEPNLDPKPLYIGSSPKVWIPLRPGVTVEDELKRWHIEINSVWEALPSLRQGFKLSDKPESVTVIDSALEFDLNAVLGNEPKGTYSLHVRGPLEIDVDFAFRIWPSLHIKDLPEYILPNEKQNTTLHFQLPVHAFLEAEAGEGGIKISGQYGRYELEFNETVSQLNLNLSWPLEASTIHAPFSLPIPRIKWRLILGEDDRIEWIDRSIRKPVDAFLQSTHTAALLVTMPRIERHINQLRLRLIDPENANVSLQEFPVQTSVLGVDYVRFLLNAKDTINQHKDISVFEFQLMLVDKDGLYQPVTLLSLTRQIDVSNVRIEETDNSLVLLWEETHPLRNRRVYIRSLWKAWADAWNIRLPDDARGKYDLLSAGYGLPTSWYEVHFYVAPSWEQDIVSPPDQSTYLVKTISPENQIAWLDRQLEKHPELSFLNHFERASLYASIGEETKRDKEIQFCYTHVDQAKPANLFAFHEWLEKYEPNTKRAVRMKMYKPEFLQQLFSDFKPTNEFRRRYLGDVTKTNLPPESAILLIENENDPAIVFHSLRELMKRRDDRLLNIIVLMLEDGRLSDEDALALLRLDEEYSLSVLNAEQPTSVNLRLLSGLLRNKIDSLAVLSNEKITELTKAEKNPETIKTYLGILVERESKPGVEYIMELFQNGLLLGEEVTDLLGRYPKFSVQVLSRTSDSHAHLIQISELAQKYPIETGHVTTGMYVKTSVGWGIIDSIESTKGSQLKIVSLEDRQVKYNITLYPGTVQQIRAYIDVQENAMILLEKGTFFQCGNCGFISQQQNFILRQHTREAHNGLSPSFRPISPRIITRGELQFSKKQPET